MPKIKAGDKVRVNERKYNSGKTCVYADLIEIGTVYTVTEDEDSYGDIQINIANGVGIGVKSVTRVSPNLKAGDTIRGVIEGKLTYGDAGLGIALDSGSIHVYIDEFSDIEIVKSVIVPPTEPGSLLSIEGAVSKAVLVGSDWRWLSNGNKLMDDISSYTITAIDRVGV